MWVGSGQILSCCEYTNCMLHGRQLLSLSRQEHIVRGQAPYLIRDKTFLLKAIYSFSPQSTGVKFMLSFNYAMINGW